MVNAKLVVVGGDAKAAEVNLKLPTVIGRGKESGLTVPHALVSRRHTEIFERDGKLFVKDLGSLNGTFVNNLRIKDEQPLEPNQLLTLGNVTFRAIYEIQSNAQGPGEDLNNGSNQPNSPPAVRVADSQLAAVGPAGDADSAAGRQIPFDETVSLESLQESDSTNPESNSLGVPETSTLEATDGEQGRSAGPGKLAADTDKSFKTTYEIESPSNVFNFDDENGSAEKSVSVSALGNLPSSQSGVSSVSRLEIGKSTKEPVSKINASELGIGSDERPPQAADDSSLGSFLRKLPK